MSLHDVRLGGELSADALGRVFRARRKVAGDEQDLFLRRFDAPGLPRTAVAAGMASRRALAAALEGVPFVALAALAATDGEVPILAWEGSGFRTLARVCEAAEAALAPLPPDQALHVVERLTEGLVAIRGAGLVHGFVVPPLAHVSLDGEVKIAGLEVAPALRRHPPADLATYLAPERTGVDEAPEGEEVFSLAAILFELLTGKPPGAGEDLAAQVESATSAEDGQPLPTPVQELLARGLAPADRRLNRLASWHKALLGTMSATGWHATAFDLALTMHSLFGREAEAAAAAAAAEPAADEPAAATPSPSPAAPGGATGVASPTATPEIAAASPSPPRRSRTALLAGGLALAAIVAVGAWALLGRSPQAPAAPETAGSAPGPGAEAPASPPVSAPETSTVPDPAPGAETVATTVTAEPSEEQLAAEIDRLLARREEALASDYEKELKALQDQLAEARQAAERPAEPPAAPARNVPPPSPSATRGTRPAGDPTPPPEGATRTPASAPAPAEARPSPAVPAQAAPPATAPRSEAEPPAQTAAEPPRAEARPAAPAASDPAPRTSRGDLVSPGPGVTMPRLVRLEAPGYTPQARRMRVEGTVILSALVDENGRVQDVKVLKGIPQDVGLNEAAVRALREARFEPATKDGVDVKVWHTVTIPFTL